MAALILWKGQSLGEQRGTMEIQAVLQIIIELY